MPDGANAYPAYSLQRELFCVFVFARYEALLEDE
ncbi:hypothetical protein SA63_0634 [Salmonella enterica subsp. enterica serovar Agona str. 63.H.87]|nr:hypothetical protein SA63_0634 [Salmonella enterica subsp. enterica serovar Agona str. 63.H.87]